MGRQVVTPDIRDTCRVAPVENERAGAALSSADMTTAAVVGSGPNGLAAALTLAEAGVDVTVYERSSRIGGGATSSELTLPGFLHDDCSAIHPQALVSPFFRHVDISHSVRFVRPPVSYAHPIDSTRSALAFPDVTATAERLPSRDRRRWASLFGSLADRADAVTDLTMHPLVRPQSLNSTSLLFGAAALWNSGGVVGGFRSDEARALLLGSAAHLATRLPSVPAIAGGLALTLQSQTVGWPVPVGGSQSIVNALVDRLVARGVSFVTDCDVRDVRDLSPASLRFLDVSPGALLRLVPGLPTSYRRLLRRFRHGVGILKVDYALDGPVPWSDPAVREAGTIHLGGTPNEMILAERSARAGRMPDRPFVIAAQPSLFDSSRAPVGKHTFWAYAHVPAGAHHMSDADLIDDQIERFAPGFKDLILQRSVRTPHQMQQHNPNYVGGDFTGGTPNVRQLLRRPVLRAPWRTPHRGTYICSSSASPGPGVHGMAGYLAARQALHDLGWSPTSEIGEQ
ncbi:phytoene desaturase family protein [Microbacterium enclense]|nr:NAD(P)/FAD-dependent oxidoreductase [Microbacterium enclense]